MSGTKFEKLTGMTPRRIEALTDGIFAIAMTLLFLTISMPRGEKILNVGQHLLSQAGDFWHFFLSFILLAIFWLNHSQQHHHIKRVDAVTTWLNITLLLFVVLIPFSATLMSEYPNDVVAEVFFNSNMLVLSLILTFNWGYALMKGFVELDGAQAHLDVINRKGILMPGVALLALALSFFIPGWSTIVYLAIPLLLLIPSGKR